MGKWYLVIVCTLLAACGDSSSESSVTDYGKIQGVWTQKFQETKIYLSFDEEGNYLEMRLDPQTGEYHKVKGKYYVNTAVGLLEMDPSYDSCNGSEGFTTKAEVFVSETELVLRSGAQKSNFLRDTSLGSFKAEDLKEVCMKVRFYESENGSGSFRSKPASEN